MKSFAFLLTMVLLVRSPSLSAESAPGAAAAPAAAPAAAEKAFTGEALTVKKELEELFDASKKVNGPEKTAARGKIEGALDWDKVARSCLGEELWKKQAGKNRTDFRNLLKEVIVKTAFSRMEKFWTNTKYTFDKIEVTGGDAHAVAKFNVNGDPFTLDYYLFKHGAKWLISDIAFEDLRYSSNINEQLKSFLSEKSFAQLLQNLRKRRDELDSGKKKG